MDRNGKEIRRIFPYRLVVYVGVGCGYRCNTRVVVNANYDGRLLLNSCNLSSNYNLLSSMAIHKDPGYRSIKFIE